MLDQPVPNPLAKNPNVHTHKVFAAVGLILIGVIIAIAGIWYYVEGRYSKDGYSADDNTYKTSTSSTKPATSSAKSSNTYTNPEKTFTLVLPMGWVMDGTEGPTADSNHKTYKFSGKEGALNIGYGTVGYGGGCSVEYQKVNLKTTTFSACIIESTGQQNGIHGYTEYNGTTFA